MHKLRLSELTTTDIPFVIDCIDRGRRETALYAGRTWDYRHVLQNVTALVNSPDAFGYRTERGVSLGMLACDWFCPDAIGQHLLLYVLPEHRNKCSDGWRLHKRLCAELYRRGAKEIRADDGLMLDGQAFVRMLELDGFTNTGSCYTKEAL